MGIQELEEEEFYDDCGNMVPGERVSIMLVSNFVVCFYIRMEEFDGHWE